MWFNSPRLPHLIRFRHLSLFLVQDLAKTYPNNKVITSKYTVLTFVPASVAIARGKNPSRPVSTAETAETVFLGVSDQVPKNVWEQFHKAANSYFLLISFIMFIGDLANLVMACGSQKHFLIMACGLYREPFFHTFLSPHAPPHKRAASNLSVRTLQNRRLGSEGTTPLCFMASSNSTPPS